MYLCIHNNQTKQIMKITKELITPLMAKELLALSAGNRLLSASKLASYSHDMKNGRWIEDTFELIKISKDGFLIDGHHRLNAIVKANVSIYLNIVRGVDSSIMGVIDTGKSRNPSDALKIGGVVNSSSIAAIISAVLKYENGYAETQNIARAQNLSNMDVITRYELNPEYWQSVFLHSQKIYKKLNMIITQSMIGKYYHLFSQKHPDKVDSFFNELCLGVDNNQTVSVLRGVLIRNKISPKKLSSLALNTYIIKTWNAYVKGTALKQLKYSIEDSETPVII